MIYVHPRQLETHLANPYHPQRGRSSRQGLRINNQPPEMRKKIQNYSFLLSEPIGKGFSSTVYKGLDDLTGEEVAIKVIQLRSLKDQTSRNMLDTEIDCFRQVKHKHILRFYNSFFTANNCYIITEYCPGGDLAKLMKQRGKIGEKQTAGLFLQIFQGYREFYQAGYVHRDLKPANIFFARDGSLRIADFGFSKRRTLIDRENYNVGTPIYMPRESLAANIYNEKTDLWALGVTLYEMLFGEVPFKGRTEQELRANIERGFINFPDNTISRQAQDFISRTLLNDSLKRMGVSDMERHPWLATHLFPGPKTTNKSLEKIQTENNIRSSLPQEGSQQNKSGVYFQAKEIRRSVSSMQKLKLCMNKKGSQIIQHHQHREPLTEVSLNHTSKQLLEVQENKENQPQNRTSATTTNPASVRETRKTPKRQKTSSSNGTERVVALINYFRLLYRILSKINSVQPQISLPGVRVQLQKACRALNDRIVCIFKQHKRSLSDHSNQFELTSEVWISFATSERWQMYEFVIGRYQDKYVEILKKATAFAGEWQNSSQLYLDLSEILVGGRLSSMLLRERYLYTEILGLVSHLADLDRIIHEHSWDYFATKYSNYQSVLMESYVVNLQNYDEIESQLLEDYEVLKERESLKGRIGFQ